MKERNNFRRHLSHYWWAYLLSFVVSCSVWAWAIPAKTSLKNYEKVGIVFAIDKADEERIKNTIMDDAEISLQAVDIYIQDPKSNYFSSLMQSAGRMSCDLYIFPLSLDESYIQTYCPRIEKDAFISEFGTDKEIIDVSGYSYGIKIKEEVLTSYLLLGQEINEEYGLFINRDSMNFGEFYKKDGKKSESNHALKAFHSLLGGAENEN